MRYFLCFLLLLPLPANAQLSMTPLSYDQLAGWNDQPKEKAFEAFKRSCDKGIKLRGILNKPMNKLAWGRACDAARGLKTGDAAVFFESHFTPMRVRSEQQSKLTGYYIPLLKGSLTRGGPYQYPLYRVPEDFAKPYLSRAQIAEGALEGKGLELIWLDDPVMRFFLHIQGSGHIELPDGRIFTAQFAAKNGRPYTAIGTVMREEGLLEADNISLQTIRETLYAYPDKQRDIFNHNASYIFFSLKQKAVMPKGAQGVPLTSGHSLAIDPAYWPYGIPIYLQTAKLKRLVIAQDTGSAIRGATRGDLFVGLGEEAEALAGTLNAASDWVVLVPKP